MTEMLIYGALATITTVCSGVCYAMVLDTLKYQRSVTDDETFQLMGEAWVAEQKLICRMFRLFFTVVGLVGIGMTTELVYFALR